MNSISNYNSLLMPNQTINSTEEKTAKHVFIKITRYVLSDILRSKIILAYTLFLCIISLTMFTLEDDASKAILSLMSIVMILVPLVSMIFTTSYFYNAYEFTELLLAQPVRRSQILLSEYAGVAISLLFAFVIGIGLPVWIYDSGQAGSVLILSGALLTLSFVSIALFASVITRDKARGIGMSLLIWFYFSIMYDAILLAVLYNFSDYPLDTVMLGFTAFNPIDLGRILIMLKLDISALMGYTGALYKSFLGSALGMMFSILLMCFWIILPLLFSVRIFKQKNL